MSRVRTFHPVVFASLVFQLALVSCVTSLSHNEQPNPVTLEQGLALSTPGLYRLDPPWVAQTTYFEFSDGNARTNRSGREARLQRLSVNPLGPLGKYALSEQIDRRSMTLWGYRQSLLSLEELRKVTDFSKLGELLGPGGWGCTQIMIRDGHPTHTSESASWACFTLAGATNIRLLRVAAFATNNVIHTLSVFDGQGHTVSR